MPDKTFHIAVAVESIIVHMCQWQYQWQQQHDGVHDGSAEAGCLVGARLLGVPASMWAFREVVEAARLKERGFCW